MIKKKGPDAVKRSDPKRKAEAKRQLNTKAVMRSKKEDKLKFIKKYLRDFADNYDCFYSCLIIIPDKYDPEREVTFFAIRGPEEYLLETMVHAISNMKEEMAKS